MRLDAMSFRIFCVENYENRFKIGILGLEYFGLSLELSEAEAEA